MKKNLHHLNMKILLKYSSYRLLTQKFLFFHKNYHDSRILESDFYVLQMLNFATQE